MLTSICRETDRQALRERQTGTERETDRHWERD